MTALNQCHVSFEDKDGDERNKEVLLATTKNLNAILILKLIIFSMSYILYP